MICFDRFRWENSIQTNHNPANKKEINKLKGKMLTTVKFWINIGCQLVWQKLSKLETKSGIKAEQD